MGDWGWGWERESDGVYVMLNPPPRQRENYRRVWSLFSSNKLPSYMAPYMNYLVNYLETLEDISSTSAPYPRRTALCKVRMLNFYFDDNSRHRCTLSGSKPFVIFFSHSCHVHNFECVKCNSISKVPVIIVMKVTFMY